MEKKEKVYFGVNENCIDAATIAKIEKNKQMIKIAAYVDLICCLFLATLLCCIKYLNKTVAIVSAVIIIVIAASTIVIDIVSAANLRKCRKQVQQTSDSSVSTEKEAGGDKADGK